MVEYRKSMKAFNTNLSILVGHIIKSKEAGKTVDEVLNDERTMSFLKNLVKSEYAFEDNRKRLEDCLKETEE